MIMMGRSPEGTPRRPPEADFAGFFTPFGAKKTGGSRAPVEACAKRQMMLRVRAGKLHSAEALYSRNLTGQEEKRGKIQDPKEGLITIVMSPKCYCLISHRVPASTMAQAMERAKQIAVILPQNLNLRFS